MGEQPVIRVGHLKITDHLILGLTLDTIGRGEDTFRHCDIAAVAMNGWHPLSDALRRGEVDAAFILAPAAMDLFNSGVKIRLLLFAHRSGSVLVTNRAAGIERLTDFRGKVVLIPHLFSMHHMLFHRLLAGVGLRAGIAGDPDADVLLEVMAPAMMAEAIQYDAEGTIGGFIVAEPLGTQAILGGYGQRFCLSGDLWPEHPCCVFVARDELIEERPEAVYEITDSFVRSGRRAEEDRQWAAQAASGFLAQEEAVVRNVLAGEKRMVALDRLLPVTGELSVIQDYMCDDMGLLTGKIDMEAFVDTRFAKAAGAG